MNEYEQKSSQNILLKLVLWIKNANTIVYIVAVNNIGKKWLPLGINSYRAFTEMSINQKQWGVSTAMVFANTTKHSNI
jgi:hypothetical protein